MPVTPDPAPDERAALRALCEHLARDAGTLALDGRRAAALERGTKSSRTDLVTQFDRDAEALIVDRLADLRPDDGIAGEESADRASRSGWTWSIDPIDGTTNYVYGLPGWATSVAAQFEGVTIAGAVFLPTADEMFSASLGDGASLDGSPIGASPLDELALALVATGFGYQTEQRTAHAGHVARLIGSIRDIRRIGAAAADLCYVACGRVDVYFERHLNLWDVAAGELIAREAGCRTSDFTGGPADTSNLVVAAPGVHGAFLALLADTA